MDIVISDSQELRDEIARLEDLKKRQSEGLRQRFDTPKSTFESVMSIFPVALRPNYFGMASRIVVPFVLNKTIFRNSNFLVRALVGLVSQKAASYISEESVVGMWHKITSIVNKNDTPKAYVNDVAKIRKNTLGVLRHNNTSKTTRRAN